MTMDTQSTTITSEDQTFERLRREDFAALEARLSRISDSRYAIVNPITFMVSVAKPFHPIITSAGWTVDEFNEAINNVLSRYRTHDK